MADDLTKKAADGKRISLTEDWEIRYWTDKFDVSVEKLREAVEAVGHMADDVARYLEG